MGSDAAADLSEGAAARLGQIVNAVFEDFDAAGLRSDLPLGDIPGWDSMNSVNLVLELESTLGVDLQGVILIADQTVGDVAALLREKGAEL